jgi:CheY-like chemotaxis protein
MRCDWLCSILDAGGRRPASAGTAPRGVARHEVIVRTGRETPAIRTAALEGGAFALLGKPFDDEVFLTLVAGALRSER